MFYQRLSHWLNKQKNLDGILVTKAENVFWLTGFKASFAMYLQRSDGEAFLITDGRYLEKAQNLASNTHLQVIKYDSEFTEHFGKKILGIFVVEDSNTLAQYKKVKSLFPDVQLRARSGVLEKLRRQKTDAEIQKIAVAQAQVDRILLPFMKSVAKAGITERELAFGLVQAIQDNGQYGISFDPIVAFGKNSSIPHHSPSETKLKRHNNILIDCGAQFEGYCSDISRNFVWGTPDKKYRAKFEILKKAQKKIVSKYQVGVLVSDLDNGCREALAPEPEYSHTLGHGVGLEIHELPRISQTDKKSKLRRNEVVTCEPGLYYPGAFGMRIEDLIVIRASGPEILSTTPRELICLS